MENKAKAMYFRMFRVSLLEERRIFREDGTMNKSGREGERGGMRSRERWGEMGG